MEEMLGSLLVCFLLEHASCVFYTYEVLLPFNMKGVLLLGHFGLFSYLQKGKDGAGLTRGYIPQWHKG